jgi:sulfur carrier protein
MRVAINGEIRDVPPELDLAALLEHLSLPSRRVAVELNREVIRRSDWANRKVSEADKIEIVHFVGGG